MPTTHLAHEQSHICTNTLTHTACTNTHNRLIVNCVSAYARAFWMCEQRLFGRSAIRGTWVCHRPFARQVVVECVFRVSSPPPLRSSKSAITRNHAVTIFTFALTSWAGWRSREKFARAPQRHATLLKHNRVFVCVCVDVYVFFVCVVYTIDEQYVGKKTVLAITTAAVLMIGQKHTIMCS